VSRPAQPLSRGRIFDAAVAIADTDGIDAVTMRSLAGALGVHPTSLYNHLASKDAILDGLVERMFEEMSLPTTFRRWDDWVTSFAAAIRRVARAHRGAFLVLTRRPAVTAAAMQTTEGALEAFTRAGLPIAVAAEAVSAISLSLLGLALNESSLPPAGPAEPAGGQPAGLPYLEAAIAQADEGTDATWALAVAVLIDGTAARIRRERRRGAT